MSYLRKEISIQTQIPIITDAECSKDKLDYTIEKKDDVSDNKYNV